MVSGTGRDISAVYEATYYLTFSDLILLQMNMFTILSILFIYFYEMQYGYPNYFQMTQLTISFHQMVHQK